MGVNHVNLATGETVVDLRGYNVCAEALLQGYSALGADGERVDGKLVLGEGSGSGGSSGGGIIEVPELPTENINENAVYKVVVNEEPTVYMYQNGSYNKLENVLLSMGLVEINAHFVDELPSDMLETDTYTGVFHGYIVNPTGICYTKVVGFTGAMTAGALLFSSSAADKGYTADISMETQNGIYVQRGKSSTDFFIRKNGEWERIAPEVQNKVVTLTKPIKTDITPDEGKVMEVVTVNIGFKTIGDLIDRDQKIEEITEDCFIKSDGTYITYVCEYAFANSGAKKITLPSSVTWFGNNAFLNAAIEEVTIKGKLIALDAIFDTCTNLKTLNVSWRHGEVSGAPWGATNATIYYNYTGE